MQRYYIEYLSYTTEMGGEWCRADDVLALEKERDELRNFGLKTVARLGAAIEERDKLKARLAVFEDGMPDTNALLAAANCLSTIRYGAVDLKEDERLWVQQIIDCDKWIRRIAGRAG